MPEKIGLAAVLDMKDFNKGLKSYTGSVKKMGDLTKSITGKMGRAFVGVGKFVGKTMVAGIAIGATAIAGLGVGMVKLAMDAAPLQGIKAAFEGITEASGVAADEMLAALKESSAGMLTNKAAMETYNLAAMLVGETFANDLPNAMGFLTKVSAATGESMDFMMGSLVKGIGRLSPMILDNLGIQVDLTKAYEDWAEKQGVATGKAIDNTAAIGKQNQKLVELQASLAIANQRQSEFTDKTKESTRMSARLRIDKLTAQYNEQVGELHQLNAAHGVVVSSTKDLTENMSKAQKQEALMAQTMALLEKNTESMPEVTGTAAAAMGSLKTQLQDVKDTIGLALLPMFTKIVAKIGAFATKNLPKLVDAFKKHVVPALELAAKWLGENIPKAIAAVREAIDWVVKRIDDFRQTFIGVIGEGLGPFEAGLQAVAMVLGNFLSEDVLVRVWDFMDMMREVAAFIKENLTPILAGLGTVAAIAFGAWAVSAAAAMIPMIPIIAAVAAIGVAVALLVKAWETDWGGIRTTLTKFWEETAKPIFDLIVHWFKTVLPPALAMISATLTKFWEEKAKPIFELLKVWFTTTLPEALVTIRDWFVETWQKITTAVTDAWNKAVKVFEDVKKWFTVTMPTAIWNAWETVKKTVASAIKAVRTTISEMLARIRAAWETAWYAVTDFLRSAWETIRIIFLTALILILDIFGIKLEDLLRLWRTSWDMMIAGLSMAWRAIKTIVETVFTAVRDWLSAQLDLMLLGWGLIWDFVSEKATAIWAVIQTTIETVFTAIRTWLDKKLDELSIAWSFVWDAISTKASEIWEAIKTVVGNAIQAVWKSITDMHDKIKSAVTKPLTDARQAIKDTIGDWIKLGKDMVMGIAQGIKDKARDVINSIVAAIRDAIKRAKALIGSFSPSKVFMEIGGSMMEGLALGVARTAAIPIAVTSEVMHRVSAPALFQRPAMTMPVSTSSTVNVDMGGVSIYDQMSAAMFEARVRQIMASAVGA